MNLRDKFLSEIRGQGLPASAGALSSITAGDLDGFPVPAQRYLRFMRVVGRPRDWSFRVRLDGRFKLKQEAPWRPSEVWQYNTGPVVTRTFYMRLRVAGLSMIGRDTYRDGHGLMVGRLLDRITVLEGRGPEFDAAELVTYLNDLVLTAPTMLLVPAVAWEAVDEDSFDLVLVDHGLSVRGRVFVDERGAPVDFATEDRFYYDAADPKHPVRTRWTTPVAGFREVGNRMLPTSARAVWHLPSGEFPYGEFRPVPATLAWNVPPGE